MTRSSIPAFPGTSHPDGRRVGGWLSALAGTALSFAAADGSAAVADTTQPLALTRICIEQTESHERWALDVELADTPAQRERGLMERAFLPANAGMLFRYPAIQPPTAGFWMPRVRFSLDIAFLDEAGAVLAIRTMPPCSDPASMRCPTYPAGVPFRGALEVNGNAMAAHGIRPGHARVVACPAGPRSD